MHHNTNRIIIKRHTNRLRPRPHLHRIPHIPFTQTLTHPPFRTLHRRLLPPIHLLVHRRRARAHIRVHGFTRWIAPCTLFANHRVAPVACLRSVRRVVQTLHERVVRACCVLERPVARWALRSAESWEGGDDDVEAGGGGGVRGDEGLHDVFWNSKNMPGQPCTRRWGMAVLGRTRAFSWTKWTRRDSMVVV
ncbi:hypothetical protein GQ44DRAFT_705638 [Phaeosphaeriaceae sp. PMI808]|nr:hypothetical protein GQ44DRAFT_705638 [Phaeosphaeriaceae sp. PMI808]